MASPTSACSRRRSRAATPTLPSTPSTCSSTRARTSPRCPTSSASSGSPRCSRRCPAPILYGDHVIAKGEALFDAICKEGGEGIIAKKAKAPYRGARGEELAQGQMHRAPGIRHRRLAGERQAARLPLASPRGARRQEADLCRQGRHRLQRRADRKLERDDGAARRRQAARSTSRARRCAGRTGSSPSWSANRVHRIHHRRHPPPPELHRAARGQEGQRGGARSAAKTARRGQAGRASDRGQRRRAGSAIPTASSSPATS